MRLPWIPQHLSGLLAAALLLSASICGALSIAYGVDLQQISREPRLWVSGAWTGGDIYDVDFVLKLDCASRPVRLHFPTVTLVHSPSTSSPLVQGTTETTAMVRLSYPGFGATEYQPKMVQVHSENYPPTPAGRPKVPGWTDYVDLRPGEATWFQVRFPLPPLELNRRSLPKSVPTQFTLHLDGLDVGCSMPLTLKKTLPLRGADLLKKLGPRAT